MNDWERFIGLHQPSRKDEAAFKRRPLPKNEYYLFLECLEGEVSFYSQARGWRSGEEIRVPRVVNADEIIEYYITAKRDYLVLEEHTEFKAWMEGCNIPALVKKELWAEYIREKVNSY